MSILIDRVHPEFRAALAALHEAMPGGINAIADLVKRRETAAAIMAQRAAAMPPNERITVEDRTVPASDGRPAHVVRTYSPADAQGVLPGVYVIHGGGMTLGDLQSEHATCVEFSDIFDAVVVQPDYPLAPEHPAPAALEDCYAGLRWMADNASELRVDPTRIALYGGSSGGGLAAGTALMARDRGGPTLCLQMLICPMLDDRNDTPSSHEILDLGVWDRAANLEAWALYLGRQQGPDVSPYAVPARVADLAGLPPTFIDVGELDTFRDEDIAYAGRLLQAGVPTELHVYPGMYHAADNFSPQADCTQRILATRRAALARALSSA